MMKPKLLITMGDSNTEGVGCWDPQVKEINSISYGLNTNRFHKFGWPPRLQIKLNYDRLINLGLGGSSDSHQLKSFIENIAENEINDYDVLVIWLMTFSGRFSFYSGKKNRSIMVNNEANEKFPKTHRFSLSYLDYIENITEDCALEQLYHIRLFSKICEGLGINFLFGSLDNSQRKFLYDNFNNYFNTENNLDLYVNNKTYFDSGLIENKTFLPNFTDNPELKSRLCGHPNERGYEFIAENIYTIIKNNFSHLVNKNYPKSFSQEWRDVKQW